MANNKTNTIELNSRDSNKFDQLIKDALEKYKPAIEEKMEVLFQSESEDSHQLKASEASIVAGTELARNLSNEIQRDLDRQISNINCNSEND